MQLTPEKVLALAPDASAASASKKLATPRPWSEAGQTSEALWGKCQGSALYTVRINLVSLKFDCSCPSRKRPCKHALGLLYMACTLPEAIPLAEPPQWVSTWLAKQLDPPKTQEPRSEQETAAHHPPVSPSPNQAKRAEKRMALVTRGIEQLDLWLEDLIRNGLASVATQPYSFWENQTAQMVDAQAPGLATRLRRMAFIPNASSDWPERLLAALGQLALLTQAFRSLDRLNPALQEDVRQLIGWNLDQDEVIARGERIHDNWMVVGQRLEEGKQLNTQYTWLLGCTTMRSALILQFSPPGLQFKESFLVGTSQHAELVYWPGAAPQRALLAARRGVLQPAQEQHVGFPSIEAFLHDVAHTLMRQPWQERFLCSLRDVVPFFSGDQWYIRDASGNGLPLVKNNDSHWRLLALSGGQPLTFFGEWDGEFIQPFGVISSGRYSAAQQSW